MNIQDSPSGDGATPATPPRIQADSWQRIKAIMASSSGNLVEWYDFYIYSFTALYFSKQFFPSGDQTSQLLAAAGVFAAGFLMRPIGSWIFGRLADRHGRKRSMLISILMMCLGSVLVGILPTYSTIGVWAAVLLTLARMLQGISVGGEYGTSATYMSEIAKARHRGFFASFQYVTLVGGQLLALVVLLILQAIFTSDELTNWAWRIPFLLGGVAALISLYLRSTLTETADSATLKRKEAGSFRALFAHTRALLLVVGITAGGSLSFYTYTTYMQKYLVNSSGLSKELASQLMTIALVFFMILQPVIGALSDRIGRRICVIIFGLLVALGTYPLLSVLHDVQGFGQALLLVCMALTALGFYTSIGGLLKAELFPMEVRALGVGLSYAIGNAVFGGSAEAVALWFKSVGHEHYFYIYVSLMAVVALVTGLMLPDARKKGAVGIAEDLNVHQAR